MSYKTRVLKRRHLIYYLEVYDDSNGQLVGHLVDVTTKGIKLVSKKPFELGKKLILRMMLPEGYFEEQVIRFEGTSKWTSNDVNPEFYDTGFEIMPMETRARQIIMKLVNLIGFNN